MSLMKQADCATCHARVPAQKNDPASFAEMLGYGMLVVGTCGFGIVIALPLAIWRGVQASHWHCTRCGARVP